MFQVVRHNGSHGGSPLKVLWPFRHMFDMDVVRDEMSIKSPLGKLGMIHHQQAEGNIRTHPGYVVFR